MNCIFCDFQKKKDLILWEDDLSYLILDIRPLSHGHLLLIPKEHSQFLHLLSDQSLSVILTNIKKIVVELDYKKYNILQNNGHIQSVNHVHFHIIPFNSSGDSLSINWDVQDVDEEYIKCASERVKNALTKK
ncbi:Hit-like hydrolase [Tubulinosema ratisbonensis]|uniref:Hit-like hydrolase n=1 Tax=Tubulinosema ratisbonensis TaxID=291195 RepID=A0A437AQI7_9MICR|nr:Hit-like hydrolase [Tubulinosema ratisbonensis]